MPRGHSLSIYARFQGNKRTSLYISREKHYHKNIIITSKHGTTIFFSHNNLFLGKLKKKNWPKKPAYILMRVYLIVLMPPGHPIQLIQYGRRIGKKVYCLYWLRPKRVPLLSKIVYKRIRGRTSRGSLPVQCIVEYYPRAKPSYDLPHTC